MTSRTRQRIRLPDAIYAYRTRRKLFAWRALRRGFVVAVAGEDYRRKSTCLRAARRNGPADLKVRDYVDYPT